MTPIQKLRAGEDIESYFDKVKPPKHDPEYKSFKTVQDYVNHVKKHIK